MIKVPQIPKKSLRRRRLLLLFATLAALVSVLLIVQFLRWVEGNTGEAKLNKIQPGLTINQVERTLGPPSLGTYSSGTTIYFVDDGAVFVEFDANGVVTNKGWREGPTKTETSFGDFIKKVLRWIGL
jgi:hypothetical protein